MGMVNYYPRHIPKLSEHAQPLFGLLKKETKFTWFEQCQTAFEHLKKCLSNPPLLQFPNFNEKLYYTCCDASSHAIAAILCQGPRDDLKPICYASRTLTDAETRYPSSEGELLAIVWGIRHYKTYIQQQPFEVLSDCKALQLLMNLKSPNSRLTRWKFELNGYDFKITHIKGKTNFVADFLSRYITTNEGKEVKVMTRSKTKNLTKTAYTTPSEAIQQINTDKTKKVGLDEIPTVIESTDDTLVSEFPYELLLVNVNDTKYLNKYLIDTTNITPWSTHDNFDTKLTIVLVEGLSLNHNEKKN